ncbi:MAG TPA: STAS domain-containing protein [Solirubrobacteraceae bacterium]|nr:STAS domain-containing protein [Solirubrobacteraceae bacterium]
MSIRRQDADGRVVLAIGGEVDLATSPELRLAIDAALDSGAAELCLDLCATSFMDSSGLHVLFDSQVRASALKRRLRIICPPGPVRRLFELSGFADRLSLAHE